jgi:hypothetical protein
MIDELKRETTHKHEEHGPAATRTLTSASGVRKRGLVSKMAPFYGTYSDESLIKLIIRPFAVLINPAVIWAVLTLAFPVLWVVAISFVIAQIFAPPPYLLTTTQLGYLSAGPLVGGTLGCLLCGFISDPIAKWVTRKNNGVYEPEFRLLLQLGTVVFSVIGYFLFGNLIGEGKSPAGMSAVWGVIIVTVQFVAITVGTYMVDAYRDLSVEIFIISMIFKNFLFFGFSCKFSSTPHNMHLLIVTS